MHSSAWHKCIFILYAFGRGGGGPGGGDPFSCGVRPFYYLPGRGVNQKEGWLSVVGVGLPVITSGLTHWVVFAEACLQTVAGRRG